MSHDQWERNHCATVRYCHLQSFRTATTLRLSRSSSLCRDIKEDNNVKNYKTMTTLKIIHTTDFHIQKNLDKYFPHIKEKN